MKRRSQASARNPARTNLLTGIVLILPLFVFYEVGVLFTDVMNGADFFTAVLLRNLGTSGFIFVHLTLLAVLLLFIAYMKRRQRFQWKQCMPVLLESGIYALTMGTVIILLMVDFLGIDPRVAIASNLSAGEGVSPSVLGKMVLSAGAGVHEEFIFRFLLMGALLFVADRVLNLKQWTALAFAIGLSSVMFAAAHHIGSLGETFRLGVFVYRIFAGILFALIYYFRNIAVAVYTHTLYDIYVFLLPD